MSTAKLKKVEDTFSERLKMLRRERGWSQEDLAARLDVSPGSVGNWEMGPHEPHAKTLTKLAALFEVEVRYLLSGEREEATTAMRERPPEYRAVNLGELLREVEDARERLERVAQQLRRATAQPGGAVTLTEAAAASYDEKRSGAGRSRAKEEADVEARQTPAKTENRHSK
jgi:transcriptional regulator with XRE-family HTH domain